MTSNPEFKELPEGHDISSHKDAVGRAMHRWKHHDPKALHSGRGKGGKEGKVVKSQDQAIAIALSMEKAGKSGYAERLQSMGYSESVAAEVASMLDFSGFDWDRQFMTGEGPGKSKQEESGPSDRKHPGELVNEKDTRTKRGPSEMLSGVSLPKGPGNPQGGSSKEVSGMRMLG